MTPIARMIDYLVDDRVGILGSVAEMRTEPGAPAFFHYVAHPCRTEAFSDYPSSGPRGAASTDRQQAATRVITDGVAAYCAALISEDDGKHPVCTARKARFQCADPDDFALFSTAQYEQPELPWMPFMADTPVQWSEAVDPLTDEPVFIPSAMRFLPYTPMTAHGEMPILPSTSTGLACHWNAAQAAIEAICDVVECDALSLLWLTKSSAPQIRVETLSDANYDLVSRFERTGGSVTLLKVDAGFGVPTILACLSNAQPSAPARVFAAGTALEPEVAVRRALEMLAHVQHYCQLLMAQPAIEGEVVTQSDHLRYWCAPANAAGAAFLFGSKERVEFDELAEAQASRPAHPGPSLDARDDTPLRGVLGRVSAAGYRTLLANLTTPDVADLGLTVVRAIVPGLQPLFFGQATRGLGGERLRQRGGVTNELPHPFPRRGVTA